MFHGRRQAGVSLGLAALMILALSSRAGAEEKKAITPRPGQEVGATPAVVSSPGVHLELHASIHTDYVGFDNNEEFIKNAGSQENNIFERRARISLRGKLFDQVGFYLQSAFDIANVPIIDAVIYVPAAPWLEFQAGLMKIPFSEERIKSYATRQPFMERSLAANLELRRSQGAVLYLHPGEGAFSFYLGCFTGENLTAPNTDDDFEYTGRIALRFERMFADFPGQANLGISAARGSRSPLRDATKSFQGKTMNEFAFFAPVPVNGYRTRYEADAEWRFKSLWIGGEIISSQEERDDVTVDLRTAGGAGKATGRDLDNLKELGWNAYLAWVITGENAEPNLKPSRDFGALELALRYSAVTFDSGGDWILSDTGVLGRETSVASLALSRPRVDETVRDLYLGLNWIIKPGVFFQVAALWQWFDYSKPYTDSDDTSDINYRARVGLAF